MPPDIPVDAEGNPDRDKIRFYLMFSIEQENLYQKVYIDQIFVSFEKSMYLIWVISISGFLGVLALCLIVAVLTSRRIVKSIEAIKEFTKRLTTCSDVLGKRQEIDDFSKDEQFMKISKQYAKMNTAKELLAQR